MEKQKETAAVSTKERILESARRQFLEKGFQGASVRKIVSDAGVTYGAMYGYFDSKEELFYALTDPLVERIMYKLDEIESEMKSLPSEKRLLQMSEVFYMRLPELVDLVFEDREVVELVIGGSKGTKYEDFMSELVRRDTRAVFTAARSSEEKDAITFDQETLEIMLEGYMAVLFHLIVSDREKEEVARSMEIFARTFEAGLLSLAKGGNL